MIKIKIKRKHKSIDPCEFELPNFSVLTGLNGSGKTHLLEAISNNSVSEVYVDERLIRNIVYIPFNGLNPKINEICNPSTIISFVKNFYNHFQQAVMRYKHNRNISLGQFIGFIHDENSKRIAQKILPKISKNFDEISEDDIMDNFDISMMGSVDFFTGEFALVFKNYHRLYEENKINEYYRSKGYDNIPETLTEEEFIEKNGLPPWDFVNNILEEINVPYKVNSPMGSRAESNFIFKLIDNNTGKQITSQDLSTGEKVLMSLALAIYNSNGVNNKPGFLLIDEPDAALHPSMSKKMINVLNESIVNNSKIPVIITSHSPTTIISTQGISIYQMIRGNSIPIKVSVQNAIEILSSEIPFLKISNDKRRQIFVESKYDVIYYELLTNILMRVEPLETEPIYLPARTSNGSNCNDVIQVVQGLYGNGNEQIYGIIDWDNSNSSQNRVLVLGENERYSIENYLLDPLMMGLLFIREAKMSVNDFGLDNIFSYSDINNLNENEAQKIIDKILIDLGLFSENIIEYELFNNWRLKISIEFNHFQGHSLETLYKEKYPFLNFYQREDKLKIDVIQKIINDFPLYSPKSIFQTIRMIK